MLRAVGKRRVTDRDGREWVVWRRLGWHPGRETVWDRFRRRLRVPRKWVGVAGNVGEAASIGELGEIPIVGIVFLAIALALLAAAVVIFLVLVLVPLLFALAELALLALLAGAAVGVRLLLRRAWTIEADSSDGRRSSWRVVGWNESRRRRDEIAEILAAGLTPPADEGAAPIPGP